MKKVYLGALFLFACTLAFGQNAMVQVIHNSPTPGTNAGPVVDIYLNGNSDIDNPDIPDLAYRFATPFVSLPAGATQVHIVVDGGNPATDTVFFAEAMLMADETYAIIANGIVGSEQAPFGLAIKDGVPMASEPTTNDLVIFHGAPDVPGVIVDARGVATLASQLEFGDFTDALRVPNDDYVVDFRLGTDTTTVVAQYEAPLATLGIPGGSAVVFASGLFGGTPEFGVFATLANGQTIALPDTAIASLQIIHNSPFSVSTGGPAVDIFVNGEAPADGPLKDVAFRTATSFLDLPGNVDLTFDVVPAGGTIDQSIFQLDAGQLGSGNYVVMAHGIAGNMDTPFNLAVLPGAHPFAQNADLIDVTAFHGAPDAPAVDVDALIFGEIIDNLEYGTFKPDTYIPLFPGEYYLGIRPNDAESTLATFRTDLNGLAGGSATVFASGFLANPNASGFGLFAALADGTVVELPAENVARVQIVHDAPLADTVDVWLGGVTKAVPDFAFETATPFLTIPVDSSISITAPGSTDTTGNFLTLPGGTIPIGSSLYVVARGDNLASFGVDVYAGAREFASSPDEIDIQAYHGSPNAPAVDVVARDVATLFEELAPGEFGDDYVSVPADVYVLDITLPGEEDPLFTYLANLRGAEGLAGLAFASGYVGRSADIDSSFKLLLALPNGVVVQLQEIQIAFANIVHASTSPDADSVDVYIGGELAIDNFPYLGATGYVGLPSNELITVNLKNSTGPDDGVVLSIPPNTLTRSASHIVVVHGDGSDDFPITAALIDTARRTNSVDGAVDVNAFHAIPGVGAVDVRNGGNLSFPTIIPDLGYGTFSDYLLVPEIEFFFRFTPAGSLDGIATFNNVILEDDESVLLLATGNVGDDPDFNLYVVLPDGSVFESSTQALLQIIHNSPVDAVNPADIWLTVDGEDVGAIRDVAFRSATGAAYIPTRTPFAIGVAPAGSMSSGESVASFDVTFQDGGDYTVTAFGDNATAETPVNLGVTTTSRFAARDGEFDLQVFHGSPDAGTVDVLAGGATVVDDLEYGTYRGYLGLGNEALQISLATPDGSEVVGTWDAPVDAWIAEESTAGTVFASGYLTPDEGAAGFELWIAFADGTTEQLTVVSSVNELERLLTGMSIFPNPMTDRATIAFELEEPMDVEMRVIGADGRIYNNQRLGTLPQGVQTVDLDALSLPAGTYSVQILNERGSVTRRVVVAR